VRPVRLWDLAISRSFQTFSRSPTWISMSYFHDESMVFNWLGGCPPCFPTVSSNPPNKCWNRFKSHLPSIARWVHWASAASWTAPVRELALSVKLGENWKPNWFRKYYYSSYSWMCRYAMVYPIRSKWTDLVSTSWTSVSSDEVYQPKEVDFSLFSKGVPQPWSASGCPCQQKWIPRNAIVHSSH
jgi:hypothetical protein